jgi:hypothetical protein
MRGVNLAPAPELACGARIRTGPNKGHPCPRLGCGPGGRCTYHAGKAEVPAWMPNRRAARTRVELALAALRALTPQQRCHVVDAVVMEDPEQCAVEECVRPVEPSRDHCAGHRKRLQRTGVLGGPLRPYRTRQPERVA